MKKIVGVLVMTLLVAAVVIPAEGTTNDDKTVIGISGNYKDSVQKIIDSCLITTGWSQQAKLIAADGEADDYFGVSVSIDGDYAILGVYGDDNDNGIDAGSAYIFKRTGMTSWSHQAKLVAADGEAGDFFGVSVSIDEEYAVVGAFGDDGYRGSAYIFKWTGIVWSQQEKIVAADGEPEDYFGASVSIDGDYAIVGMYGDDNDNGVDAGSAYIFKRNRTTWSQQAKLTAADGEAGDYFGVSVSINEDYTVVGAYYDDNDNGNDTGSAYIFKHTGMTSWSHQAKLVAADGEAGDFFGVSVSIDEEYAVVGAFGDDGYRGSAYIFKCTGTTWSQQDKIVAVDGEADDRFGVSTSISKEYVVIGAFYDDNKTGSAYIFKRSSSCWSQEDKLVAWDDASGDRFGCFVSISGFSAILGAYYDDNSNGNDAGSAYIFNRLNNPPDIPDINGPTSGKVRTSYSFSSSTTDPDGDSISYFFDWGDGTNSGWLGPYASGVIVNASHVWGNNGTYDIKVKALDELGSESDWSDPLSVSMPKNKAVTYSLLQNFLEIFPNAFPILRYLLKL